MKVEEMAWKDLVQFAKANGLATHKKKRAEVEREVMLLGGIQLEEKREEQVQGWFRQELYNRDCTNVARNDGSIVCKVFRNGRLLENGKRAELDMVRHAEVIAAALNDACRGET